jgi:Spy/CpxP family protein refolding chaperone
MPTPTPASTHSARANLDRILGAEDTDEAVAPLRAIREQQRRDMAARAEERATFDHDLCPVAVSL